MQYVEYAHVFFIFWFFFPLFERAKFGVEMSDSIHSGCSFFFFVASHTLRASLSVAMGWRFV